MIRLFLLCLVFVSCRISVQSQTYQLVKSGQIRYFSQPSGSLTYLSFDSVLATGVDTTFYLAKTLEKIGTECVSPNTGAWLGRKILLQGDSLWLIINRFNDTIVIYPRKAVGTSWTWQMNHPEFIVCEAHVVACDTMRVFGVLDSVKTIEINFTENSGDPYLLKVGKYAGIVSVPNLFYFPYDVGTLVSNSLVGQTNPTQGVQNITYREVYDFEPGDELHISKSLEQWTPGIVPEYISDYTKTIYTYLSRQQVGDTLRYEVSRKQSRETLDTFFVIQDTIVQNFTPDKLLDSQPGEVLIDNYEVYHIGFTEDTKYLNVSEFVHLQDTCLALLITDGMCYRESSYFTGRGGPYYVCNTDFIGSSEEKRSLVYYKKGEQTWGTPLVISPIRKPTNDFSATVYPNPVGSLLNITVSRQHLPCTFSIYNVYGREVAKYVLREPFNRFVVSHLPRGVYVYKITSSGTVFKTGKIVKD